MRTRTLMEGINKDSKLEPDLSDKRRWPCKVRTHPEKYFGRELNWTRYYMCHRNLNNLLHIPDGYSALSLIMIQSMLHLTNSFLCHNFENPGVNYAFLHWSQTSTHQLQRQWPLDALNQYNYSNFTASTHTKLEFCQAGSFRRCWQWRPVMTSGAATVYFHHWYLSSCIRESLQDSF